VIDFLTRLVVWLNWLANACGSVLLAPIGVLPGWLSATLVAAVTGVALVAVFKYTSNQRAIKRVKDDIKANLLALKLFNTSASVALGAQGRVIVGAGRLFALALVPMLVMAVPVLLVLGQLSLWYQARPLAPGEDAVVTLQLNPDAGPSWPDVQLEPCPAVDVTIGPVRVRSKREVCWNIQARRPGRHRLVFRLGDQTAGKDLVIGERFMRVSSLRPGWDWSEALMHPAEEPFPPGSPVRSIAIDYPQRSAWTSGADTWVVYWFVVSMVSGFAFRPLLNVNM
jgi:hypothetical protein